MISLESSRRTNDLSIQRFKVWGNAPITKNGSADLKSKDKAELSLLWSTEIPKANNKRLIADENQIFLLDSAV